MIDRALLEILRTIIRAETIYLRHYAGKVFNDTDPEGKGRVLVGPPELGCFEESVAFWCWPRDKNSLSVPKKDDWVEIYFMGGDKNRPVYLGKANEMSDMIPKNFDGKPTTHVLFESPNAKQRLIYDENLNILKIGAGAEPFVLGQQLLAYLQSLGTALATHVHLGVTTGPGTSGTPAPGTIPQPSTGILSTKVKGE